MSTETNPTFDVYINEVVDLLSDKLMNNRDALLDMGTVVSQGAGDRTLAIQNNPGVQNAGFEPIGVAPDYSNNIPSLSMVGIYDPVVAKLFKTFDQSMANWFKNDQGDWVLKSYQWNTVTPQDDGTDCCFVRMDLQACQQESVPVRYLCLRDCEDRLDVLMMKKSTFKGTDLINFFQRKGMTYDNARLLLAWYSFAFYTVKNIMQGDLTTSGNGFRPFAGLASLLANPAVVAIPGANLQLALEMVRRRIRLLRGANPGQTDYFLAVHPLTYSGVLDWIKPDRFGNLPEGWSRSGDNITFDGMPFLQSNYVAVDDETTMTGTIYVLDARSVEITMEYPVLVPRAAISEFEDQPEQTANGCAVLCTRFENYGAVHTLDYNRQMVITGVPLSPIDMGVVLQGLDGLIHPDTIFPRYTVPTP